MAKKQTRKSVSVSGAAYAAAMQLCDEQGRSLAGVVDQFLRDLCGLGARESPTSYPIQKRERPTPQVQAAREELDAISATRQAMASAAQARATRATLDAAAAARQPPRAELEERALARPCRIRCGVMALHESGTCAAAQRAEERAAKDGAL